MKSLRLSAIALSLLAVACNRETAPAASVAAAFGPANPFARASTLPFQAPPFDKITNGDYQPALEEGMRRQLRRDPRVEPLLIERGLTGQPEK